MRRLYPSLDFVKTRTLGVFDFALCGQPCRQLRQRNCIRLGLGSTLPSHAPPRPLHTMPCSQETTTSLETTSNHQRSKNRLLAIDPDVKST